MGKSPGVEVGWKVTQKGKPWNPPPVSKKTARCQDRTDDLRIMGPTRSRLRQPRTCKLPGIYMWGRCVTSHHHHQRRGGRLAPKIVFFRSFKPTGQARGRVGVLDSTSFLFATASFGRRFREVGKPQDGNGMFFFFGGGICLFVWLTSETHDGVGGTQRIEHIVSVLNAFSTCPVTSFFVLQQ